MNQVVKERVMCKIIISVFLVLIFFCSCAERSETALEWINKAHLLWDGEKYTDPKKAIEYLNNAVRLQPYDAIAYNNRGLAYTNLSDYQSAIEDYKQAIRLKPDYADAYNNRGSVYLNQGNNELGCRDGEKACALGDCKLLKIAKGYCR